MERQDTNTNNMDNMLQDLLKQMMELGVNFNQEPTVRTQTNSGFKPKSEQFRTEKLGSFKNEC